MSMASRNFNIAVALAGLGICFSSFISANSTASSCLGPIQYYKELECTPIFKTPNSSCPERYDCDHLKSLPNDKCVINGHEYAVGQRLRKEDSNPCDAACRCVKGHDNTGPSFRCAMVSCFSEPPKDGCYFQRSALKCCPDREICPENPDDRPTCMVDGKKYKDGERFEVPSEPNKSCYCGPGYTGENVAPFCHERKNKCGTLLRQTRIVRRNCVPVYYHDQSVNTSCNHAYRCQNANDVVIARSTDLLGKVTSVSSDPNMKCTFGNLTMNVGDELNQATDYSSVCVKCVCEIPPVPTCQRLSDQECDVTEHPDFRTTSRRN